MNGWPMRALAGAALLAALALLAAVIAWWGWRIAGPAPVRIPATAPADPAAAILASGLLAVPGSAPPVAPTVKDEGTLATGNARLLGVVAERDGRGYALFRLPSGPRLVAPGQEIAQGAQLVDVQPGVITIRDGGGERRIMLRGDPPPAKAVATAAPIRTASRSSACTPPAGFKGPVLRVNAELFQGIIAKPESWAALVAPVDGVLSVRDDSGFVGMLAMKKGDRLATANGIALAMPDDVVAAVLRPLAASQPVRVSGSRDGAPREWLLLNAGTCPA
jgi:Type II secretion system protein C